LLFVFAFLLFVCFFVVCLDGRSNISICLLMSCVFSFASLNLKSFFKSTQVHISFPHRYVAVFWTGTGNRTVSVPLTGIRSTSATVRDVWARESLPGVVPAGGALNAHVDAGGAALFRLS
jgi:hypothetical protein